MKMILALFLIVLNFGCAHPAQLCFQSVCVNVAVVSSPEKMAKGLSGHAPLKKQEGMLFSFNKEGYFSFWMHEMTFDLDILWLDHDGRIVHIEKSLKPCGLSCPKYVSSDPALHVLEVPAGFCQAHRLKIGDVAKII